MTAVFILQAIAAAPEWAPWVALLNLLLTFPIGVFVGRMTAQVGNLIGRLEELRGEISAIEGRISSVERSCRCSLGGDP